MGGFINSQSGADAGKSRWFGEMRKLLLLVLVAVVLLGVFFFLYNFLIPPESNQADTPIHSQEQTGVGEGGL